MINLLKADLFRLRKSTTFRTSMILMGLLVIGFSFLYCMSEDFLFIHVTHRDNRTYGFLIGDIKNNIDYLNFFRSSLGFTLFTCLTMVFLVTDSTITRYSNGILKNIVSYGHDKYKVYLSNLISNYVGVCIVAISYIVFSMITAICLFPPERMISKDELYIIFKITIVLLIILGAMISFYTLISTVIKSKAIITTLSALFMVLVSAILFDAISASVKNKIPIYMLLNICGQPTDSKLLGTFVINSVIIIFISTVLGCIVFKKQEIK